MGKKMVDHDWQQVLKTEFDKPYYTQLHEFLEQQYANETVYPPKDDLWSAFEKTSFKNVKVVILGQDPYHGPGQAHGMSFSVKAGIKHPPSLRNMLKELNDDLGCELPEEGMLTKWAQQGVFLLNTVLTVRAGAAHSHKGQGWELFTDEVIRKLSQRQTPVVFVLWGKPAQLKRRLIDTSRHAIVESVHPSPLSAYRGFLGSKPYSKINEQLTQWGIQPIDFCLK
ncbi:uracil-DNA glycosylase [Paenisporosarcina antarctica]|nr:uracil-DNA glycosylase [Paenisporosarcina antarctica]